MEVLLDKCIVYVKRKRQVREKRECEREREREEGRGGKGVREKSEKHTSLPLSQTFKDIRSS